MKQENYYETTMDALQPPAYLKDKVLQEARALKAAESQGRQQKIATEEKAWSQFQTQTQAQSPAHPQTQIRFGLQNLTAAAKRQTAKHPRFKFGFIAAAACLSILVFAVGSILVAQSSTGENGGGSELTAGVAGDNGKFSLQAYASVPNRTFASSEDIVLFGGAQGNGSASEQGMWTGNLFEVTGKDIVGVEASLSKGQLYLYAEEEYLRGGSEDPVANREAAKLSIANKLKGQVDPSSEGDSSWDFDEFDHNKISHFTTSGARLLGSNFSLLCGNQEAAVDLSQVKFGFFVNNEDVIDDDAVEDLRAAWHRSVDAFDGQTLHIEVKFDDGTQSSKSYVLHTGKMKIEWQGEEGSEGGNWLVLPEFAGENEDYLYAIYATVAS